VAMAVAGDSFGQVQAGDLQADPVTLLEEVGRREDLHLVLVDLARHHRPDGNADLGGVDTCRTIRPSSRSSAESAV
jgi:hypothetical protein